MGAGRAVLGDRLLFCRGLLSAGAAVSERSEMYEAFYGLSEKPFGLTPNPKFLFLSSRHNEAMAHLDFGHRERGGFIVISGEVGTGKTTLARYFLSRLDERTRSAVVLYPALTAPELLRCILTDLRIPHEKDATLKDLVDALHSFLLETRRRDQSVVLLIDESQDLPPDVLEQVRLISNLETDQDKLIQIVLIGQSELLDMLERRDLRQLAQRVTSRYHLTALDRGETDQYIRHRLAVAGGAGKVAFTHSAIIAIHRFSKGIPRVINLICDRALLAGYVKGHRTITASMSIMAAKEALGSRPRRRRWPRVAAAPLLVAGIVALALTLWFRPPTDSETVSRTSQPAVRDGDSTAMPAATPVAIETAPLEPRLVALSREDSFQDAARRVRSAWDDDDLVATTMRTHLAQVKRMDMPVIIELFHPARRDTCFVALLRLDSPDTAVIAAVGDDPQRVMLSELDRYWTRLAVFLWKDHDRLLTNQNRARLDSWTRNALKHLGYDDEDFVTAIKRFQQNADLVPDGAVGRKTLLALYSHGRYAHPRLSGDAS
ncbi:MAG: AAA family ATPase [Vicinamibacteria bacterium]|nr:AAA family ATPase [Vicinamibacteria bacterium]